MMRITHWIATCLPLALSGCASLYINDASLAKKTDAADAVVQSADTLKPYTVELGNIDRFSGRQDQAVAARDVAQRDDFFTGHLSEDAATLLHSLDADACQRLAKIVGNAGCGAVPSPEMLVTLQTRLFGLQKLAAEDQATLAATRAAYERIRPVTDDMADDCDSVLKRPPPSGTAPDIVAAFDALKSDCRALSVPQDALARRLSEARLDPDSDLAKAELEAEAAIIQTTPVGLKDAALNAAIENADALARSGDLAKLKELQENVEDVLKFASPVARIAGLSAVQSHLDDALKGLVCPPGSTDANCGNVAAASTSGRTAAVWTGLEALAQYFDANDPRYRSASWLAAANAILTAEKSDAQIQARAAKDAAALATARANRLWLAARYLSQVHEIALAPSGSTMKAMCPDTPLASCALAVDLDAWNYGLIPADVLRYRETLVFARTSVQRQQAAQVEQQALARAASTSLKNYADGGIPPAVIAQLLVDLGLTAAVAVK